MKLVLEISTMESHATARSNGSNKKWVRLSGTNQKSEECIAFTTGFVAEALVKKFNDLLLPGETVDSRNFMIDLTGEWRTENSEFNGKSYRSRRFYIETFDIVLGHNLELAKIRKDGSERLVRAEQYRSDGKLEMAYRELVEFASRISGRQIDINSLPDPDEMEFGQAIDTSVTPEAAAAARFKAADRTEEKMEMEASQAAVEQTDLEAADELEQGLIIPEESGLNEVVEEAIEDNFDADEDAEVEGSEDDEQNDPLDDEPVAPTSSSEENSVTPKPATLGPRKPTAFPRFGFPRPGA